MILQGATPHHPCTLRMPIHDPLTQPVALASYPSSAIINIAATKTMYLREAPIVFENGNYGLPWELNGIFSLFGICSSDL